MCLRPIIVFFPLRFTIAMCVQSPITLGAGHLLLCSKSQNMLGLAWVKQVIPKNTYNICVEKLRFYKSHQTTSSKQFEFLGDRGGRACLVVLPYRSLVHHRIWELFSASLTLESEGLPRIWRDFRIVQVIHRSCLPCEYDIRHIILVGQALRSESGARSHALVGWIRDTNGSIARRMPYDYALDSVMLDCGTQQRLLHSSGYLQSCSPSWNFRCCSVFSQFQRCVFLQCCFYPLSALRICYPAASLQKRGRCLTIREDVIWWFFPFQMATLKRWRDCSALNDYKCPIIFQTFLFLVVFSHRKIRKVQNLSVSTLFNC